MKNRKVLFIVFITLAVLCALISNIIVNQDTCEDICMQNVEEDFSFEDFLLDINTIYAHNEQDTIIGDFRGLGFNDTLFVEASHNSNDGLVSFYMVSTNKNIPKVRLYGCKEAPPKLVAEGDLDINGTEDVGYLSTGVCGRWRSYNILTFINNEWRYLVSGEFLFTSDSFRASGIEVAEQSNKKGTILIHYYYEGYNDTIEESFLELRDTVVFPTFDKIDELDV